MNYWIYSYEKVDNYVFFQWYLTLYNCKTIKVEWGWNKDDNIVLKESKWYLMINNQKF